MARVLVVTSHPPFTRGGHLVLADQLVAALRGLGHDSDLVYTPQNRFGRQGAAYLATWLTDVGESDERRVDQVISLRFPAYAVRHPRHVCWLLHTMREYYDLWPTYWPRLSPRGRIKEGSRRFLVHRADRFLLRPGRLAGLFTISGTVSRRLEANLGIRSTPLHPPAPARPYRCDGYGDYIFVVSRLTTHKRVALIVRALAEAAASQVSLVVAGDGPERAALVHLARELGVEARVTFLGEVSESELIDGYAACRAVAFTPFDEDYGFVTPEAFSAAKAVVTCRDSGGPTELVVHDQSGFITEPTPAALAAALGRLWREDGLAERLGQTGAASAVRLSWPATAQRLLVV